MKTQKLIPLLDYVLEQSENLKRAQDAFDKYVNIVNYAKFLSQPLKLSMFVPCDENEVPIEEPYNDGMNDQYFFSALEAYNKAKSNVLFETRKLHDSMTREYESGFFYFSIQDFPNHLKINDFATLDFGLTLTENAVKLING